MVFLHLLPRPVSDVLTKLSEEKKTDDLIGESEDNENSEVDKGQSEDNIHATIVPEAVKSSKSIIVFAIIVVILLAFLYFMTLVSR